MTMKNIMSILQCGPEHRRHNHSGSWYTCRYCRRTMCRVCFLQWSTELKDRGVRLGWYNISEIKRQRGALQMTRRLVDARLCGQCCSKLWHEIGFATLCRTSSSLPLHNDHFSYIFFRVSRNTVKEEIGLLGQACWPSWKVASCQHCQHDPVHRNSHTAMDHVGNHRRCHLGHHGSGVPCGIVSTTSLLTTTIKRLKTTVPWLHVIGIELKQPLRVDLAGHPNGSPAPCTFAHVYPNQELRLTYDR